MSPSELAPDHEELLRRMATGEVDETDPDVQRALAQSAGLRDAWSELRVVVAALDRASEHQRGVLEDASDVQRLEQLLEQQVRTALRPRWFRRGLWIAAAAAAVLVLWWQPWQRRPETPGAGPVILSPTPEGEVWPDDQRSDYTLFRWKVPAPEGGGYRLSVLDGDGRRLFGPIELDAGKTEWRPGAVAADWPAAGVELRLVVLGPQGNAVGSYSAWTWREPR